MPPEQGQEHIRKRYSNIKKPVALVATDEYGFVTDEFNTSAETYSSLKMQWYVLIDRYGQDTKAFRTAVKQSHLLDRGIPLALKHRVWKDLVHMPSSIDYEALKRRECKYEYQIHVDIQRTFRYHFLFSEMYGRGQTELFNLLVALANYDKRVGYCQGMSDVCAVFLMYFSEREAFDMYISLMQRNGLSDLFDSRLSKLPQIMRLQNSIFSATIPGIAKHLGKQGINFSIHGIGWYMTFFARFNIRLVLRIWDFLIFYGFNVLFYFAAAILEYHEKEIVARRSEELLEIIGKLNEIEIDEDIVVSIAVGFMRKLHYKEIK